jgi:hypothetical protein
MSNSQYYGGGQQQYGQPQYGQQGGYPGGPQYPPQVSYNGSASFEHWELTFEQAAQPGGYNQYPQGGPPPVSTHFHQFKNLHETS